MHDTFLEKYCIRCINPQNETTQTHFDRQNMRDKVILFFLHSQISTRNIFYFWFVVTMNNYCVNVDKYMGNKIDSHLFILIRKIDTITTDFRLWKDQSSLHCLGKDVHVR